MIRENALRFVLSNEVYGSMVSAKFNDVRMLQQAAMECFLDPLKFDGTASIIKIRKDLIALEKEGKLPIE